MAEAVKSTEVLICVKCRAGIEVPENGTRPGEALFAALAEQPAPEGVNYKAVECLSNCNQGCSVAVRGGSDRWTYVYGNLSAAEHVDVLREGITKYQASADGVVPWRERPEHFRKNCIARIPPLEV